MKIIHAIMRSFFKLIVVVLVFATGYILAHEKFNIPILDKAIDKAANFCDHPQPSKEK